jgi:hypothetical protein
MRKQFVIALMAATIAGLFVVPARAANPSKGPLATTAVIACTIHLDSFPSGPGKRANSSPCTGVTNGVFAGLVQTAPGGVVAGVAAAAPTAVTANYEEPCVAGALGFSNGVGTVGGLIVSDVTKAGSPTLAAAGVATVPYSWTRVGVTAVITAGKLTPVTDPLKPQTNAVLSWSGKTARDLVGLVGLGVLVPLGVPDEANCPGAALDVAVGALLVGA